MISFVWSSKYPFLAGSGGSETYTAGHIRELLKRGIEARIITIGHGEHDGRADFPDIPFMSITTKEELAELDDLLVYVIYPLEVKTKRQAYAILHCPPPAYQHGDQLYKRSAFKGVRLLTASKFAAGLWRRYLKTNFGRMPTVYPFADVAFSNIKRPSRPKDTKRRILFAGRLITDKGIYTLLAALHMENMADAPYELTVTTAGSHYVEGAIILKILRANPLVTVVPARKNAAAMAQLMAEHDVVVMPSTAIFWQEQFGMISIEAQHAGCRVVASRSGGLPETNIGGVMLVKPDNPKALANALVAAMEKGPLTAKERQATCRRFSVEASVDSLLKAINFEQEHEKDRLRKIEMDTQQSRRARSLKQLRILQPRAGEALFGQLNRRLHVQMAVVPRSRGGLKPAAGQTSRRGANRANK